LFSYLFSEAVELQGKWGNLGYGQGGYKAALVVRSGEEK
jgi:hypothetical protein